MTQENNIQSIESIILRMKYLKIDKIKVLSGLNKVYEMYDKHYNKLLNEYNELINKYDDIESIIAYDEIIWTVGINSKIETKIQKPDEYEKINDLKFDILEICYIITKIKNMRTYIESNY